MTGTGFRCCYYWNKIQIQNTRYLTLFFFACLLSKLHYKKKSESKIVSIIERAQWRSQKNISVGGGL